ncbi:siderophore-interacting protein [Demequina litorisediminis]|uniref:FAD-binding FR-type domain-containing protein n=1 Tax=Demequina litorisediminis TaxID=1849022 RepID=A0ABQ6IFR6_9MICO|nr:siderophore-interacting protein [Demequina litorisediminis]GMA36002.1 hypothetical protein GCM10025876_22060 [Demequina litorisediminis]
MRVNRIHRAVVTGVERLTPGMMRVAFGGEGLADFTSSGVGDEYFRLFFPHEGETEPALPTPTDDGYWEYPEDVDPAPLRTYTVRAWDEASGILTVDFVVHQGGVAAAWALAARPGDVVGVNTPTALYAAPEDIEWQAPGGRCDRPPGRAEACRERAPRRAHSRGPRGRGR